MNVTVNSYTSKIDATVNTDNSIIDVVYLVQTNSITAQISVTQNVIDVVIQPNNVGLKGDKGDDGYTPIKGIDYFDGQDGYTPVKGVDYFDGEQGIQGEKGETGLKGDTGLTGAKGETGLTGPQGIQGENGIQGIQGERGLQGEQGLQGIQGIQGIQGLTGLQGPQGESGKGTIISETITFINESNYVEKIIANAEVLPTSTIFIQMNGSEEVAIQSIICGIVSQSEGGFTFFAGTPHGATGTYNLTIQILN
jgi:hypothetical protein